MLVVDTLASYVRDHPGGGHGGPASVVGAATTGAGEGTGVGAVPGAPQTGPRMYLVVASNDKRWGQPHSHVMIAN